MRFIDPDGQDVWDFLRGVGKGAVNGVVSTAKGIAQMADPSPVSEFKMGMASTIANPRQALNNVKQSVSNTIQAAKNDKTGEKWGEIVGNVGVQVGLAVAGTKGLDKLTKTGSIATKVGAVAEETVTNPVPSTLARAIANKGDEISTLGLGGESDVFVTAASDISGLNASQIAEKLTIPNSSNGFVVIEFNTPQGIASPVFRTNPGFVGRGRTAGGAREFTIPNRPIPDDAVIKVVK